MLTRNTQKKRRRRLDLDATLKKYEQRMRSTFGPKDWALFRDAWIGTYKVYSQTRECIQDPSHNMYCHAMILLKIVREQGIHCLGVCSERISGGEYVCSPRIRNEEGGERVVYVDSHNYFTKKKTSPFALRSMDKVYTIPITSGV